LVAGIATVTYPLPASTNQRAFLGADVAERIYAGMGHTINDEEVGYVRELLSTRAR
jgi:predicted esterase